MAIIDTLKLARALHDKGGFCPIAASIFGLKIGGVRVENRHPKQQTGNPRRSTNTSHGYAFSSRLSSFRKRQSVCSAMSFCGFAFIKPTSCSRSA